MSGTLPLWMNDTDSTVQLRYLWNFICLPPLRKFRVYSRKARSPDKRVVPPYPFLSGDRCAQFQLRLAGKKPMHAHEASVK